MAKIPIILRSVALVCLAALVFAVGGLGMTDSNNPVLLALTMASILYFVLELCAIVYKLFRYRSIEDSDMMLKWATYQQNHRIEFKVVAVLRRFALLGTIALIVSLFVKVPGLPLLSNFAIAGYDVPSLAKGYTQASIVMLLALLIMTFVKSWYAMHTSWEGSYSTFSIFMKYIKQDFAVPGDAVEAVLYVLAFVLAVVSFLVL